jgi:hypothetical protein
MIRNIINCEKVGNNSIKIVGRLKVLYLAINYEKGSEKEIELNVQVKYPNISGYFRFFTEAIEPLIIRFNNSINASIPISTPYLIDEIIINVNYINTSTNIENVKEGIVDIYPFFTKA